MMGFASALGSLGSLGGGIASAIGGMHDASAAARDQQANQQAMLLQQMALQQPYMRMGTQGVKAYNNFMEDPNAYMKSPAYQWQQSQIDKNMNRQLAVRGRSNSTYGMNSLANAYGELGTREYQNAYGRLWDPIRVGQQATNQAASYLGHYGDAASQSIGNEYSNRQNALYGGIGMGLAGMNAFGGMGGGSLYGQVSPQMNNYYNALNNGGTDPYGPKYP